jgi:hypothetical protein
VVPIIFTGYVWRHWRQRMFSRFHVCQKSPPPPPIPVNLVLQYWCKALQSLYCTIRRLFVAYSRTIRTIRRLFADYSYYSSTIRGLFVLFVDYSHYSLHYSSFINCRCYSFLMCFVLMILEQFQYESAGADCIKKWLKLTIVSGNVIQ